MKFANIKYNNVENGPGVRTALFVSGCTHHCKGCFNEIAWDFNYGEEFTNQTIQTIMESCKPPYIAGLTLLGGEPMEPQNQYGLLPLVKRFKEEYPDKSIWCYTGYTYESDLLDKNGKARCDVTDELLTYIDVLVDGEFVEEKKNLSLEFRGSENQRILHIH